MTPAINNKLLTDFFVGIIFLMIAVSGWLVMASDKASSMGYTMLGDPGAFLFPTICLSFVLIMGVYSLLSSLINARGISCLFCKKNSIMFLAKNRLPCVFLGSMILMPLLMTFMGTFLAIFVCASFLYFVLGDKRLVDVIPANLFGFSTSAFFVVTFSTFLNVPLP